MTNDELDTIVAERMGWERERRCRYMGPGVECVHTASLPCPMVEARQCDGAQQARPPSITTDWAVFGAALEAILRDPRWQIEFTREGPEMVSAGIVGWLDGIGTEAPGETLRIALAKAIEAMPEPCDELKAPSRFDGLKALGEPVPSGAEGVEGEAFE